MIETAKHLTELKEIALTHKDRKEYLQEELAKIEMVEHKAWNEYHDFKRNAIKEMEGEVEISFGSTGAITITEIKKILDLMN